MKKEKITIDQLHLSKPTTGTDPEAVLIIELEDKGQDYTEFQVDKNGFVLRAVPFQTDLWKGAYIPLRNIKVGRPLPIHHPPHLRFTYLTLNVVNVKTT